MTYLKYYADEAKRFGSMGPMDQPMMMAALEKVYTKFGVARIGDLKISKRKIRRSARSTYRGGLGMFAHNPAKNWKELRTPRIVMHQTMMTWQYFLHEVAHHVHSCRYDANVRKAASEAGIPSAYNSPQLRKWAIANAKSEHAHGPTHRGIMQELVDYFVSTGDIKVLPAYMTPPKIARVDEPGYAPEIDNVVSYAAEVAL